MDNSNGEAKRMKIKELEWEEDYFHANTTRSSIQVSWHLKRMVPAKDPMAMAPFNIMTGPYSKSLAWVHQRGERRYHVSFVNNFDSDKTFRSLKAAKAYAVAIVTLEQT